MKKIVKLFVILLIFIVLLFAFMHLNPLNHKNDDEKNTNINDNTTLSDVETEKTYIDDNPIKIGIYLNNDSNTKRTLMKEFSNKWIYYNDIVVFNIIFTDKPEIEGIKTKACFTKYLEDYKEDLSKYQVGFHIKFTTKDGTFDKTILSPKDTEDFFQYLEVYLYDGYHRKDNEWYSHTTEKQFNSSTLFTAIKLTTGKQFESIISDIDLEAFTYDNTNNDDFDENNNYIGNSKSSVIVKRIK